MESRRLRLLRVVVVVVRAPVARSRSVPDGTGTLLVVDEDCLDVVDVARRRRVLVSRLEDANRRMLASRLEDANLRAELLLRGVLATSVRRGDKRD